MKLKKGTLLLVMFSMLATGCFGTGQSSSQPPVENDYFDVITDLDEPKEIHTAAQKEYLSYTGNYHDIPENLYPDGKNHLSDPLPVNLEWDYEAPDDKEVENFSVIFGQAEDLSDGYEVVGSQNGNIDLYNVFLGTNYFKIVANFTDGTEEVSNTRTFKVDETYPRNLAIGGMTNNRDLGGRLLEDGGKIKQGLVYRTSGFKFDYSTEITAAGREVMLGHMKVKTEVNVADGNNYNLSLPGTTLINAYMDYDSAGSNSLNHFTRNAESVKDFFEIVADNNNYPVYFHCRIGTDRTGLCSILLNGLLGVSLNEIYQDYLFSNFGKIGEKRYIGSKAGQDDISIYISFINSLPGTTFKNKVYNALLAIGLAPETLNTVINNLTEGTPAQGNDAGQIIAPGQDLLPEIATLVTTPSSDRNHPDKYYNLNTTDKAVRYTFNAEQAFTGVVVAYLGKNDNSTTKKIGNAVTLTVNNNPISIIDRTYRDAGMGKCGTRINYFPVVLAEVGFVAGSNTIRISGTAEAFNIGGVYIFDKTK